MQYDWIDFYTEFATKLLPFKDDRKALIHKINAVYSAAGLKIPKFESDNEIIDIDPFTIFGTFNKGITDANRKAILGGIAAEFGISAEVPNHFDGIPVLNNLKAMFYDFKDDRQEDDIDNLWHLFEVAIVLADNDTEESRQKFSEAYDKVHDQLCVSWNITMGLYWIRPYTFITLDSRNRSFIVDAQNLPGDFVVAAEKKLKKAPYAADYLEIRDLCQKALNTGEYEYKNFPDLSYTAWLVSKQVNQEKAAEKGKKTSSDFVQEIKELFEDDDIVDDEQEVAYPKYTVENFLEDVYMSEDDYSRLVGLLRNKKNIILQGAPGVGKTYAAKRLAYSMMGVKDVERVMMVQFHQSYSYEDFMMGYKPVEDGFELKYGIFYRFCQKAANQPDKDFFFIIDEINRGNMSKIFGELLMLIERDYRGTKATLAYNGLSFSVPKNLYIIGIMNTADRSLAMIDYALRRRFSFFEVKPGFDSDGFIKYQNDLNNETLNELVSKVKDLNHEIAMDKSLGKGFCIGHSYFCGKDVCTDEWLHSIVDYDILPMLSEYWFDDAGKLQRWENILQGVFQ